jgi:hypothetical protein
LFRKLANAILVEVPQRGRVREKTVYGRDVLMPDLSRQSKSHMHQLVKLLNDQIKFSVRQRVVIHGVTIFLAEGQLHSPSAPLSTLPRLGRE